MSQVRTLATNFTTVTIKMWRTAPKVTEIGNFCCQFSQKGYTPLNEFYKIWVGGGSPRFALSRQILLLWPPKSPLSTCQVRWGSWVCTPAVDETLAGHYNIIAVKHWLDTTSSQP